MAGSAYSPEEIETIYRRNFTLVYQLCLVLMRSVPDAEDAAQTVFRRVMEREQPFCDLEHERAWLIVTARNECRDQLKHWWRARRGTPPRWIASPGSSPGTVLSGSRWRRSRESTGWYCFSTTMRATPPTRLPG